MKKIKLNLIEFRISFFDETTTNLHLRNTVVLLPYSKIKIDFRINIDF